MIIYFVNRNLEVLGLASTNLNSGYQIVDDELTENIDTGVASLTATVAWSDDTRLQLEEWADTGNYILTEYDNVSEVFTIITSETDTAEKAVSIYAEDAGLDLLNEIAPEFTATVAHDIEWYILRFLGDADFEIGTNEIPDATRKLAWTSTSTVTERIRSIATQFDNAEISYSFAVDNLNVTHKYINIWEKRGTDIDKELRLNREINSFRVIKSVEELYTGLVVTGATPSGSNKPITLKGYTYDDGDIYIDANGNLLSRDGADRWGRLSADGSYIMGQYSYDTTSKATLCARAVAYLKQHKEPTVNYEVEIERGTEDLRIGDRVNLVDDKGGIYVSARVLELRTSITQIYKEATLGEYLIKSSGISDTVLQLASQFAEMSRSINDYELTITSSNGDNFATTLINTVLTANVLCRGEHMTAEQIAEDGLVVNWYADNTLLGTGITYTVTNQTAVNITARLETI